MSMFKSAATKIAHNSTIPSLGGNKDLRPLQDLITAEKVVLISLQKLSVDFGKAAEALRAWGAGEGDDLGDTLSASTTLLNHFSSALSQYASHGHPMRDHLKSIRTREENLDELKRRRKNVGAKAETAERKLSKMSPEHKNLPMQTDTLNSLRAEIRSLDSEIMSEEAALGDFKRTTTRAWMGLKFGGLVECAEKGTIAGEYGRLVIAEVPEEQTQPGLPRSLYYGQSKTESLVSEAHRCINEISLSVVPSSSPQRPNQFQQFNTPQHPQQTAYQDGAVDPRTGFPLPPAADGWPPHNSSDMAPPGNGPPNYLLPPQNLGTGNFPDQSNMSAPGSPIHPQYASRTMPHYPQIESHEPVPPRSVDDFGVNQGPSSPIDPPGAGGAGRFATFPVKARAPGGSGFTLRDDPPSLNAHQEVGDSFSSSIAEALGSSHQQQQHEAPPRASFDRPAPVYENAPVYSPPQGPPPGVYAGSMQDWNASPQSQGGMYPPPTQGQAGRHSPNHAEDDALLAYMTTPGDDHDIDQRPHPGEYDEGKHVRFGRVSDVDEEIDRRGGPHQPSNGNPPQYAQQPQNRRSIDSGHAASPSNRLSFNSGEISPTVAQRVSPTADHRFQNQHRIAPPALSAEEEERALNAAAAREISRELDSLNFNPPVPIAKDVAPDRETSPDRGQAPHQSTLGFSGSPPSSNDMSPLAPPTAPFAKRTSSPRPASDAGVPPYPGASPYVSSAPHTPTQTYTEPQSYTQEPPDQPQSYMSRDDQSSPTNSTAPGINTSIPPAISLPNDPPARFSPSPYQTPPEYPRGLSATGSPITKSTTSLNSQIPAGARTISAAAFRRPPQRMASGEIGMGLPMSDTSPLSFKKRLPSSPYPQQRETSPMSRGPSNSISEQAPPPQAPPANMLPPVPVEDDDYDYLSAYVNSGSPPGETGGGPLRGTNGPGNNTNSHGYGEGRFATNLEGGGLR